MHRLYGYVPLLVLIAAGFTLGALTALVRKLIDALMARTPRAARLALLLLALAAGGLWAWQRAAPSGDEGPAIGSYPYDDEGQGRPVTRGNAP